MKQQNKSMIRKIITDIMLIAAVVTTNAENILSGWEYTARLGYNIGGTAPIGLPATIRSMNKYTLKPNFSLGIDAHKPVTERWGVLTGLHLENKGMEVDATVKNYHITMTKGGDEMEGYYTGSLVNECDEWMLTLPVMATFNVNKNVMLKLGPYISYVSTTVFKGYVYDGYLRHIVPIGEKIEMGNTDDTRGTFDFSDKMRRMQVGIDVGADWQFSHRWGMYADLQWGLNGIHHSSFKTIEQTLYPIFGTVGVMYKLK